jgi:hypothetical protein
MERQLRNASSITACTPISISYVDSNLQPSTFSFSSVDGVIYIASGSSYLTTSGVEITAGSFKCSQAEVGIPSTVKISITAREKSSDTSNASQVTIESQVSLRSYSY